MPLMSLFLGENEKEDFAWSTSELLRDVGAKLQCHFSPVKPDFCFFIGPNFGIVALIVTGSSSPLRKSYQASSTHSVSLLLLLPSFTPAVGVTLLARKRCIDAMTSSELDFLLIFGISSSMSASDAIGELGFCISWSSATTFGGCKFYFYSSCLALLSELG